MLSLYSPALCDIAEYDSEEPRPIELELRDGRLDGKLVSVLSKACDRRAALAHPSRLHCPCGEATNVLLVKSPEALGEENVEPPAQGFLPAPTEDLLGTLVVEDDALLLVDGDDGVCSKRDDPSELRLGQAKLLRPHVAEVGDGGDPAGALRESTGSVSSRSRSDPSTGASPPDRKTGRSGRTAETRACRESGTEPSSATGTPFRRRAAAIRSEVLPSGARARTRPPSATARPASRATARASAPTSASRSAAIGAASFTATGSRAQGARGSPRPAGPPFLRRAVPFDRRVRPCRRPRPRACASSSALDRPPRRR